MRFPILQRNYYIILSKKQNKTKNPLSRLFGHKIVLCHVDVNFAIYSK